MRRYSKWMFDSSTAILAFSIVNLTIPHAAVERIDFADGPPPIEPWKFDSIVLAVLAVVVATIAAGLWKQGTEGLGIWLGTLPNKLSYCLLSLAMFEFVFGLVVAYVAYEVTYGTNFGDLDLPYVSPWLTFWHTSRPLLFTAFWITLAWDWKKPGKRSALIALTCGALAIFSYAAVYQEFYIAYLNVRQFGSDFRFVSYWSSGNWDLIRTPLWVAALILWPRFERERVQPS